ncbi:hypothetical protein N5I18_16250 [Pseudomonas juntendi]|uniref:hypothetical protein n=1 Tax=Pseudomonas juntendi TaxID=2666183 RepID=UPI002446B056|nr:hypothetical protein [Pseudomonas juntendi]MDH1920638.1 hypothetical protein [Pseudomonas juntendi]
MSAWSQQDFALALVYIFMALLSPVAFKIGRLSIRYIYHRYFSMEDIYVTYKNNGAIVARYKIERRKDGSIKEIDLGAPKEAR